MYPSRSQYKTAVLNEMFPSEMNGGYSFRPVFVKNEPVISAGGNATVFKVTDTTNNEFALKLFADEIEGRFQRLSTISNYINTSKLKFFTHFKFVQGLIYVEMPNNPEKECYFPGIVMKWIQGDTLDIKIKDLVKNNLRNQIKKIAENFRDIAISLLENEIAHGDLKLSNIIVGNNGQLFLIDYDGMYLPELEGQQSLENGTPSYQHPKRTQSHFDSTIDHFSILNIYLSLLILSERPELFEKYNDGDNIIFTKEDFENPGSSELFKELNQDKIQERLIFYFKKAIAEDSISIDNIGDLIKGKFPSPQIEITHSPSDLVIGQSFTAIWTTSNVERLELNGEVYPINGQIEGVAEKNQTLVFAIETPFEKVVKKYAIPVTPAPRLTELKVNSTDLKFDEPLVINWKAENSKKVTLSYEDKEIDVTNDKEHIIPKLKKDTLIHFALQANVGRYSERKELMIRVHFPVKLTVKQERIISFINRPVKLLIEAENAELIILKPGNIDLTGKKEYEIKTGEPLQYEIIASNKRYSESFNSFIDVIKPPSYNRKIIAIPTVNMNIPNLSLSLPKLKSELREWHRPNKGEMRFNKLLDMFNIFKISFKRQKR